MSNAFMFLALAFAASAEAAPWQQGFLCEDGNGNRLILACGETAFGAREAFLYENGGRPLAAFLTSRLENGDCRFAGAQFGVDFNFRTHEAIVTGVTFETTTFICKDWAGGH